MQDEIANALQWIIESTNTLSPNKDLPKVRIVRGRNDIEHGEYIRKERLISVKDEEIRLWFEPYSEPGAPTFSSIQFQGLFEFLTSFIWPRIVNGRCVSALLDSYHLEHNEQELVSKYKALKDEQTNGSFGFLGYTSPEYRESSDKSTKLFWKISRIAQEKYARAFLAFCLRDEISEIYNKVFSKGIDDSIGEFRRAITSFVEDRISDSSYDRYTHSLFIKHTMP